MPANKITKEEYLNKEFDYSKLTKQELRQIMSENAIEDIPPLTALKSVILEAYKKHIHDRIDQLTNSYTDENIFQNERKKISGSASERNPVANKEDTVAGNKRNGSASEKNPVLNKDEAKAGNKIEIRINKPSLSHIKEQPINEGLEVSSSFSELNSTSFLKAKKFNNTCKATKEKDNSSGPVLANKPVKSHRSKWRIFRAVFLLFICAVCFYFKFICPYCKSGMKLCINIPPNSKLENGNLICKSGYKLVRGIVNICVVDNKQEEELAYKCNCLIKMLEYLKGDFIYGFAKSPKVKLSLLVSDEKLNTKLSQSPKVLIENDFIQARFYRVSFRIFMKFYALFLIKILSLILISFIFLKFMLSRRRKAQSLNSQAAVIAKDILDILSRQVMLSVKSSQFKASVTEQQMRDALEIKQEIWPYVKLIVKKNSNIQCETDDHGLISWKWIGPVLHKIEEFE